MKFDDLVTRIVVNRKNKKLILDKDFIYSTDNDIGIIIKFLF